MLLSELLTVLVVVWAFIATFLFIIAVMILDSVTKDDEKLKKKIEAGKVITRPTMLVFIDRIAYIGSLLAEIKEKYPDDAEAKEAHIRVRQLVADMGRYLTEM